MPLPISIDYEQSNALPSTYLFTYIEQPSSKVSAITSLHFNHVAEEHFTLCHDVDPFTINISNPHNHPAPTNEQYKSTTMTNLQSVQQHKIITRNFILLFSFFSLFPGMEEGYTGGVLGTWLQ